MKTTALVIMAALALSGCKWASETDLRRQCQERLEFNTTLRTKLGMTPLPDNTCLVLYPKRKP